MTQANSVDQAGSWTGVVLPVTGHGAVRVRPSTRSKGLGELQRHNIVETSSKVISEPGAFIDFSKRRHVHEGVGL